MLFSTYEIANLAAEELLPSFKDMIKELKYSIAKISINTIEIDTQKRETIAIIWKMHPADKAIASFKALSEKEQQEILDSLRRRG